ncbi:PLP-dependent aminotransferase family protein [uncultured Massilia sp.]|uniref:aminotransferase-like domain-containing protein n=1 Tax=uncultured Massilia sp. TaxID=169973 RepID=UPI0025EE7C70|nr:PLP-dependent aminotransferase family protein [uncultured Massilia sp.]
MKLYESLAADVASLIEQGVMREGERIPSVRQTSQHHNLSISTVIRAYLLLESQGLIESRPQSGYFVRPLRKPLPEAPAMPQSCPIAVALAPELDVSHLVLSTLRSIEQGSVPFGSPYPDPELYPAARINQHASSIGRQHGHGHAADLPPGNPELIRQIARRHLENGLAVDPNEILITVGATEAINLCLQAVARPGDAIAVESPCYYAVLHAIANAGMRAVEIPADGRDGISLEGLERAIREDGIVAAVVMPNYQNPLGFEMSDARKRALVDLMHAHGLPLIENDVYNELYFGDAHPTSLKGFDRDGLVLHCNSFSKSLTPASRIGWTLPGRYRAQVEKLKFLNTLGTPALPQLAIAQYLQQDGYDFHLRRLRKHLAQQARIMAAAVRRFFPPGTTVSEPAGGYVLWVGLPGGAAALPLYARAQERGISVGPGDMFATGPAFRHHIRLNYSYPWTPESEAALRTLGLLAGDLARRPGTAAPVALAR